MVIIKKRAKIKSLMSLIISLITTSLPKWPLYKKKLKKGA
jgi:hypothetical protein